MWKQVKLPAASSIDRPGRPSPGWACLWWRVRGVGPSSTRGPATSAKASAVVRSSRWYPPEASSAAPIIGPIAHANDHVERKAGVRRRATASPARSWCVRARAKICGKAAVPALSNPTATSSRTPEELLHSYTDLSAWSVYAGLIDAATGARLNRRGAASDFRVAVELREAIFDVFAAVGRGRAVPATALARVQARYAEAMAQARLVAGENGYDWRFAGDDPGRAWWPTAISAVRLLTGGPLDRVKVCAAEAGCIGLFLDTSKNRSRRWCTMDGCGVDAKVQRQATRRQTARRA